MAGLHHASGPAPSGSAGIAVQKTGELASSDKGKLRVFISYSRDDLDFADQLDAALDLSGFECFLDREGISGGEDWKRRLGNLISEADTVIFVLSPSSARSETCYWEVEEAARLNKRILPANWRPLDGVSPPPRLRDLNYIFFYKEPKVPGSGFGTGLANLVAALNTDFDWLREHTRYLQRAMEWDKGGRPANRLLSGNDILEAKAWAARRSKSAPEPTALQLDFILASEEEAEARLADQRKQLESMAAAQAEREKALHEAEEAQRKRVGMARIRNIALVAVSILAVVAVLFGWLALQARTTAEKERATAQQERATAQQERATAELQRVAAEREQAIAEEQRRLAERQRTLAEEQRKHANTMLVRATRLIIKLHNEMDDEAKKSAFDVFRAGADQGDATAMSNLGMAYLNGRGVARDYVKAREWYQKSADKGNAAGMAGLGMLYVNGHGVARDYVKAREWFQKAADRDHATAMTNLGMLYVNGHGVARDYVKAREWYQKSADKGNAAAKAHLDRLPSLEAAGAGRHAEALQLRLASAAKVETEETIREGKPGKDTAQVLRGVAWLALFAREFTKALTDSERALALLPDHLGPETNRAHALMFLEREEEAKALYLANLGKRMSGQDSRLWEHVIVKDFAALRQAGLTHPMMADIEEELGVLTNSNSGIDQR